MCGVGLLRIGADPKPLSIASLRLAGYLDPYGFLGQARGPKKVTAAFQAWVKSGSRFIGAGTGGTALALMFFATVAVWKVAHLSLADAEAGQGRRSVAMALVQETEYLSSPEERNAAICFSCEIVKVCVCGCWGSHFCRPHAPCLPCCVP